MKRSLLTLAAAIIAASAFAVPAGAKAPAPKSYTGTVVGTQTSGNGVTDNWTISNLKLRRSMLVHDQIGWHVAYKVAGGSVAFSEVATGQCSHTVTDNFALKPVVTKYTDPPLSFDKFKGRWSAEGALTVEKQYSVTDQCTASDGTAYQGTTTVHVPTLMALGAFSRRLRPGRRLHLTAHSTSKTDGATATDTWKISLSAR